MNKKKPELPSKHNGHLKGVSSEDLSKGCKNMGKCGGYELKGNEPHGGVKYGNGKKMKGY